MYKSPIEIIYGDMQTKLESDVFNIIQNYGVDVDKDELIRALQYDRGQYDNGYRDGYRDGIKKFIKYLEEHSFLCDPGNMWSFQAIDADELDDFAEEFLEGE